MQGWRRVKDSGAGLAVNTVHNVMFIEMFTNTCSRFTVHVSPLTFDFSLLTFDVLLLTFDFGLVIFDLCVNPEIYGRCNRGMLFK